MADKELPRARKWEQEPPGNRSWEAAVFRLEQQPQEHFNKAMEAPK